MRISERKLSMAEISLIAGTRVGLGIGVGLLLSAVLSKEERKAAGIALVAFGAITTVPLIVAVIAKKQEDLAERSAA